MDEEDRYTEDEMHHEFLSDKALRLVELIAKELVKEDEANADDILHVLRDMLDPDGGFGTFAKLKDQFL